MFIDMENEKKIDASKQCPHTGEKCEEYGSGYCSSNCPYNPNNKEDDGDELDND